MDEEYIFKEECYQIIGCCMEVHNQLGGGFREAVYQEALELEFIEQDLPYQREKKMRIKYKKHVLKKKYFADFLCFDEVVIELKAVAELTNIHKGQLFNYLKASDKRLGMLINFGSEKLEYKRFIF
ncbi:MAG: GxxExxY protein [Bacteroidia bacterium]|nr:GxxExxY protein [Bacteroidia bacterium]